MPVAHPQFDETVCTESTTPEAFAAVRQACLRTAEPCTLAELLGRAAQHAPNEGVVCIQADGAERFLSYSDLRLEAEKILCGLRRLGMQPQAKVLFQTDLLQDFIPAFWACILGGFVPVPMAVPPSYDPTGPGVAKIRNVWQRLEHPLVVAGQRAADALRAVFSERNGTSFQVEAVEALRCNPADTAWHNAKPEDVAVLLLTSGSTGQPKAVMLSHRNIISSITATAAAHGFTQQDVSLNWMPLDHGGSLLRCLFRCVYLCCKQVHAPTERVLQDPLRWLDWIERYRATITWAPNFAFALITDRANAIAARRWDLSSLRSLLNTAEPVVPRIARQLLSLLAPHGLAADCMHMSWGMAETSSGVTFGKFTLDGTSDDDAFVDLGHAVAGIHFRIVDDSDRPLTEGSIGRLQVKGETVTAGYYRNDEANREAFTSDGWFKTGDLAFLRQGRLTLTGREKDVIIVNGVNYYSHEVEALVEQVPGVEVSYTAACAVRDGRSATDKLAVFLHSATGEAGIPDLIKRVRGQVVRSLGINPAYVIPVSKDDIPKTSLGKIQRGRLQQRFRAGEFDELLEKLGAASAPVVAPRNVVEEQIAAAWKEVFALPRLGIHDNFFELGGHSLLATQLISRLQDSFQTELPLARLFEAPTVEKLAQAMVAHEPKAGQTEKTARILKQIEALSAGDLRVLLEQKRRQRSALPN